MPRACTYATWRPRKARRPDSTWPLTSWLSRRTRHPGIVDLVLANNRFDARIPSGWQAETVRLHWPPAGLTQPPRLVLDDVVDPDNAHHHDPARLAAAVMRAYEGDSATRRRTVTRTA